MILDDLGDRRWVSIQRDALAALQDLPDNSIDSLCVDPPAGIEFMGREWDDFSAGTRWEDYQANPMGNRGTIESKGFTKPLPSYAEQPNLKCKKCGRYKFDRPRKDGCESKGEEHDWETRTDTRELFVAFLTTILKECHRVMKPGAHGVVWSIPRTSHWTAWALENAGFEIKDSIDHVFSCLDEETEILVDGRWELYHKAGVGRHALCYDLAHDTFAWRPIEHLFIYDHHDTAYRVCGDRTDQLVTRNHRCLVERGGAFVLVEAEEAARELEARVPVLEDLSGLLAALPLPYPRAGDEESVLLRRVREEAHAASAQTTPPTDLPRVPAALLPEVPYPPLQGEVLLDQVRGSLAREAALVSCAHEAGGVSGEGGLDGAQPEVLSREDAGSEESRLEGWGDVLPHARSIRRGEVRALPAGVSGHGPSGRVRHGAPATGGTSLGEVVVEDRDGASPRSRSHEQPTVEPGLVRLQCSPQVVRASRFTSSDLVRFEPVRYDGIVWCVKVPTGAFVVRRRGKIFITGNSGFPKGQDVSKGIDEAAGVKREIVDDGSTVCCYLQRGEPCQGHGGEDSQRGKTIHVPKSKPATPEAEKWAGWKSSLKPAHETWWLVRKPLSGTIVENILKHGVGALNIDACRVKGGPQVHEVASDPAKRKRVVGTDMGISDASAEKMRAAQAAAVETANELGRYPGNFVLSHSPSCELLGVRDSSPEWDCAEDCPVRWLDQMSGVTKSGSAPVGGLRRTTNKMGSTYRQNFEGTRNEGNVLYGDEGGASRCFPTFHPDYPVPFIYEAKAPASEKDAGTNDLYWKIDPSRPSGMAPISKAEWYMLVAKEKKLADEGKPERLHARGNIHPTPKSVSLMGWLAKLVTPPNGIILDCFAGSHSTGIAALVNGFRAILVDKDPDYCKIGTARLSYWEKVWDVEKRQMKEIPVETKRKAKR